MVRQLVAKLRQKRKGIILINAVLASIIVGLVGIALASIYSGMFSTMSAGKAGSQGEQMASVESSVIKMKGYDESDSVTHDWKDMSDLVGEDGKNWESKVTLERTKTTDDGNTVKVMKVAVRKTGDLISRYSAEVPLVEGLDVYNKDEIDQMFTTLNSQISQLSSDLDAFKKETADNFTNIINNINQINANLDDLQKMLNAETQARVDADKAISNELSNETKARQDADAALSNQIDSLKSSLTDLQSALNTEISNRQDADKTLQGNIDSEAAARKEAINNLQAQINSKYEELYNLYKGLKSRLDGNEFVKSKDALNNIALKYEQKDGESTKSLHGYVDGVEVPLASQNSGKVGMPDYSKAMDIKGKCPFTAPSNGYVLFAGDFDWAAGVNGTGVVINNKYIVATAGHGGNNGTGRGASLSAVSKGDIINTFLTGYNLSISSLGKFSSGLRQLYFIPAK